MAKTAQGSVVVRLVRWLRHFLVLLYFGIRSSNRSIRKHKGIVKVLKFERLKNPTITELN